MIVSMSIHKALQRTGRWLKNRRTPGALILLYHRVAEVPLDPQLLCVTPQHFAEHLEILRKDAVPMRLQRLPQAVQDGSLSPRAVVITFDDGYADNLYNAKPLLEKYDIPATIFVTSGYVGSEREFWWDELERVLLHPRTLPKTLRLSVNGSTFECELDGATHYDEDSYQRHRSWSMEVKDNPSPRHRLYRSLCELLRPLSEKRRRDVLQQLLEWASVESNGRRTHRVLSPEEVSRLAEGGLVEVGAHTITHPLLSALPLVEQCAEIRGSKARLDEILGQPVTSFAYPYGGRSDYTAETASFVKEAGFELACSNFPGQVWRETNCFQLPRMLVRDWDGEEFARRLRRWFRG